MRMTSAQVRSYRALNEELADDQRRAIEAAGGVAPFRDGTPKTIIRGEDDGYRAMCSCGFAGALYTDYIAARSVARQHRCGK